MATAPFRLPPLTTNAFDSTGPGFDEMEVVCAPRDSVAYLINGVDNLARAGFASAGLVAYSKLTGTHRNESAFTAMRDILNDLHHLADAMGIDWQSVSAQNHYDHEIHSED
ncbi:MAG: hypothetical protein WAV90_05185 [Gordonia amarae]